MRERPQTYKKAAQKFNISVDSLQSRIKGAILKFKKEFPEFLNLDEKFYSKKFLLSDLAYNGLWRKSSAKQVAPLYRVTRIDSKTEIKTLISNTTKPKKLDLTISEISHIKALAIEKTPYPMFPQTEYFGKISRDPLWDYSASPENDDEEKERLERNEYFVDEDPDELEENETPDNQEINAKVDVDATKKDLNSKKNDRR